MKYSKVSLLSMMLATMLLGLALSVEASSPATGSRVRRKARGLQASSKTSAAAADDATTTDAKSDDDITTATKSIASKTSSVVSTKKDLGASMSIRFVKPETAAPSVAPPTPPPTTKKVHPVSNATSTKTEPSASTSTSSSTVPVSSPSTAKTEPARTSSPTITDLGSIASRTATDGSTKVPLSASMEFETAETSPPNTTHTYTKPTSAESEGTNTTVEGGNEDDYLPVNGTSSYSDESTDSPMTSTSAPKVIYFTEQKQPEEWPEFVGGLFVAAALAFFAATAFKNYRKRKEYEKIPESLTV